MSQTPSLNTMRHDSVFNSARWNDTGKAIHVIGAGATGSKLVLGLARLGITNIHAYDFDIVESHNISNQAFRMADIGRPKVEALYDLVLETTGIKIHIHNEKVEKQKLDGVVFLMTDTMSSRTQIFKTSLKMKPKVERIFETRMDYSEIYIHQFRPMAPKACKAWENTLFTDEEADAAAETTACGGSISVGMTSGICADITIWKFVEWANAIEQGNPHDTFRSNMLVGGWFNASEATLTDWLTVNPV